MADSSKGEQPTKAEQTKTLEMRVAELEDKLSKVHISEDELKAFQKVSSLMGGNPTAGCVTDCVISCINECTIRQCIIRQCIINQCIRQPIIRQPIIRQCTWECFECGGGAPGGGFGNIGGFGSLGG